MKTCPSCGIEKNSECFSKRSSAKDGLQSYCRECGILKKKKWESENKDRVRAYSRAWNAANPEKLSSIAARSYAKNREKILEGNSAWAKANPEKRREIANRYYHKHKERYSEYRLARPPSARASASEKQRVRRRQFPDKLREQNAVRRARKKNATGSYTSADISLLLTQQKWKCAYCKTCIRDAYHVDHITPLAKGGHNDKTNLQMLCPKCNCQKNARDPISFAQSKGLLL